jgi:hypothetical protein
MAEERLVLAGLGEADGPEDFVGIRWWLGRTEARAGEAEDHEEKEGES